MILQILQLVAPILDRVIPDPNKRLEVERDLQAALQGHEEKIFEARAQAIIAQYQHGGPLERSWRPILMFLLMAFLIHFVFIAPILGIVEETRASLAAVPEHLWNLLMIGMGGYIFGRSAEKIAAKVGSRR